MRTESFQHHLILLCTSTSRRTRHYRALRCRNHFQFKVFFELKLQQKMYCTTGFYSTRVNANFVMLKGKFHEPMNKEKGIGTDRRVQD